MQKIAGILNLDSGKTNTFRKKQVKEGSAPYLKLSKLAEASLGSGNLRKTVKLPPGEDLNEWLAYNVIDFFNQINMLYESVSASCTKESCPVMNAGAKYEYKWADSVKIKKPISCSAPEYVDYLMSWIQDMMDNQDIFPSEVGKDFPKDFKNIVGDIFRRLFRVYAHIYLAHHDKIKAADAEAHLNTSFRHFIFFCEEFDLIPEQQLAPLESLIAEMRKKYPKE